MRVSLRLFAGLHDLVGRKDIVMDLAEGATVDQLKVRIADEYPVVRPLLKTLVFAIDDEYIPTNQVLHEGAEVSLIPPVSGGAQAVEGPPATEPFWVTGQRLEPHVQTLVDLVRRDDNGAIALFYGVVRNNSEGRRVEWIEYEAHESMALKKMREVAAQTKNQFPAVGAIGVWHRIGTLEIGETSLLVAVASPHRKEAFEACHWAVDRIKEVVPVWKKEHWQGGAAWVGGHPVEPPPSTPDARPEPAI